MKILLVSLYFWHETFRVNDLAEELLMHGNEVTVLTGKPNYPQGHIYKGYKFWGYTKESYNGIQIIRVPLLPRGKGSGIRLALNYLSFVFFSCLYILLHRKKYDVSLTFAISPITQVYAALLHKAITGSRAYLWVRDLWHESVIAAGKMRSSIVYRILNCMVKSIYYHVDGICIQSEAFAKSILEKGDFEHKISYIPNWAEDIFINDVKINRDRFKSLIPCGFIVMFTGNIGEAQDFDSIIKAAVCTKDCKSIKWVIVGDGRKKEFVEQQIRKLELHDTVILLGRYPLEDMPDLFVHADAMLVSLKDHYIFSLTIPSKIQSYMAFGKPLVSMMNGIGTEIIENANCGYTAAGDYKTLADNIKKLSEAKKEDLLLKEKNGKLYYNKHFSKDEIISRLIELLQNDR